MKIIILAGGSGTRLWPVSQDTFPKQCLKLGGTDSLLQKAIKRFLPEWAVEDLFIVTNREILGLVETQVAQIDPKLQILVEPQRKNTAPAIAFAVQEIQAKEDEVLLISTSDHWIEPKEKFLKAVKLAEKEAKCGKIVTFGIQPNKPETGYGYIEVNKKGEVLSFTEKPHRALAQEYLLSGNYLWNSGIFAFSPKTFWEEVSLHCPDLKRKFEEMPALSIDYALMEKSKKISVIPLDVAWSDIGTWDSVFEALDKDGDQNVKVGNVLALDTKNSLIMGGKRLIVAIGLEDALVVETEEALYLGKRNESQRVKAIVEELKKSDAAKNREEQLGQNK